MDQLTREINDLQNEKDDLIGKIVNLDSYLMEHTLFIGHEKEYLRTQRSIMMSYVQMLDLRINELKQYQKKHN